MKPFSLFASALLLAGSTLSPAAQAAPITETYASGVLDVAIADDQPVLTSFLQRITGSAIVSLTEVVLRLELRAAPDTEGFASDMFASLIRSPVGVLPDGDDPAAVLLNRVGITSSDAVGFGYDGWDATFLDAAAGDVHLVDLADGALAGEYQPDGRLDATDTVLDRPALLGVFVGGPANGDWLFNVGDLSAGGTMNLVSWTLTLTGEGDPGPEVTAVPEPSTWAAVIGLTGVAGLSLRRRLGGRRLER